MKKKLVALLNQAIDLFANCDQFRVVRVLEEQRDRVVALPLASKQVRMTLADIERNLVGMGSLSDFSLVPNRDAGFSEMDAAQMQWNLVVALGEAIREIREGRCDDGP